jgi:hypothetical protein
MRVNLITGLPVTPNQERINSDLADNSPRVWIVRRLSRRAHGDASLGRRTDPEQCPGRDRLWVPFLG